MVSVVKGNLSTLKAQLSAQVDAQAEELRGSFITLGPGQAMVYAQKQREADLYTATPDMDTSTLKMLTVEASARGITVAALAAEVEAAAAQWLAIGAAIEAIRVPAKAAIASATTAADARSAAVVDWSPIEALAGS